MEDTSTNASRELTFGEKAVGVDFNPALDQNVFTVKKLYAEVIDKLHYLDGNDDNNSKDRLLKAAISEAIGASMWAVKALTYGN